jgi:HNH endonuclease
MKIVVAVTDNDWFHFLRERKPDEVNFWQPSARGAFRALQPGEPFLFKLHSPHNYIVGGGFFLKYSVLPASVAWEAFGENNGAGSLTDLRRQIEPYRTERHEFDANYNIGCIVLCAPFLLPQDAWLPSDTIGSVGRRYKSFDVSSPEGRSLWGWLTPHAALPPQGTVGEVAGPTLGGLRLVRERLGQGGFRVLVTDAYARKCAVTREKVLPALDAAHIRPVREGGRHRVDNGLLLRSDIHRLFDAGYVTITPDLRFLASPRLTRDFENGEEYIQLSGRRIVPPDRPEERPSREYLEWHADTVFVG